jgi:hypothetical protein
MHDLGTVVVHHPVHASAAVTSTVFADAARTVLEAAPLSEVRLVSPYLAHAVIAPLVHERSFRLVTDLSACFSSRSDGALVSFLAANLHSVRHLESVHAKVFLTDGAVLFGSANLTRSGFAEHDELNCLLFDNALVRSIACWFEGLWSAAEPTSKPDLDAAAERGRKTEALRAGIDATDDARTSERRPGGRTLGWLAAHPANHYRTEHEPATKTDEPAELAGQLHKLTHSRGEAEQVLSLLAQAIRVSELRLDDRRLHLNFGTRPIAVGIGQRYVAWCTRDRGQPEFGFILDDLEIAEKGSHLVPGAYVGRFRRSRSDDAPTLHIPLAALGRLPSDVIPSWERAIKKEVERRTASGTPHVSGFLRCKRPFLYHALVDASLRARIADEAHPQR